MEIKMKNQKDKRQRQKLRTKQRFGSLIYKPINLIWFLVEFKIDKIKPCFTPNSKIENQINTNFFIEKKKVFLEESPHNYIN